MSVTPTEQRGRTEAADRRQVQEVKVDGVMQGRAHSVFNIFKAGCRVAGMPVNCFAFDVILFGHLVLIKAQLVTKYTLTVTRHNEWSFCNPWLLLARNI